MGYRDIYNEMRTKPQYYNQANALLVELQTLEGRNPSPKNLQRRQTLMLDFLRMCDFNAGFLVPYFFPRYPGDAPLSLRRRPFAFSMYTFLVGGYLAIRGSRQISKCRAVRDTAPVWDKHGRPLRPAELQIGQEILSVDDECCRTVSKITAIHQTGQLDVYRVTFRSGRSLLLSGDHKLRKLSDWEKISNLRSGDRIAAMRRGGLFGTHTAERTRLLLTAYMLGDGSCVSGNFNFTSECEAALDEFQNLAEPLQDIPARRRRKKGSAAWSISLSLKRTNQLRQWLEADGMWGKHAWEKEVPAWVYELTADDTRLFLSRLWATDGSVKQSQAACPQITFTVTSEQLAEGVQSLLCKFGIESTITSGHGAVDSVQKRRFHRVRVKGRASWRRFTELFHDIPGKPSSAISIPATASNNNDDVLPKEAHEILDELRQACQHIPGAAFKPNGLTIERAYCPNREKLERYLAHGEQYVPDHPSVAELRHWLFEADVSWALVKQIEHVGTEPCWDIEVEGTHAYVVDGIVSHNSTSFAGRQLINAHLLPHWQSMYVCPHGEHRNTYANKLREMEMACRFYRPNHKLRQNLFLKEFDTGRGISTIELVKALTSAAHIRGKRTDELLYDEYQLFDVDLEGEIDQTIKTSEAKIRIYAGTATTIDSPLEDRYQGSSQATWFVKGSKGWIDFGDKTQALKMIRPQGLRDPWDSTRTVDILAGQWVHRYPDRMKMHRVGFHIPQLIIPDFVYDLSQWSDILQFFIERDEREFLQEVLGIPVEEGSREITQKDLERICVLGRREKVQQDAKDGKYKFVISAFDWGGADSSMDSSIKTSYTAHVMIGITYNMECDILHMRKHSGMAYRDITDRILTKHFELRGDAIASDHGGGSVYNQVIREDHRVDINRHLVMNYTGPNSAIFAAPRVPDPMYNQWAVNKTESLSSLFEMIKRPEMPIRCYDWDQARGELLDFLNSFRVVSEAQGGARRFRYIRPASKSDDIMQSTNFGMVLAKVLMGKPIIQDPGLARELEKRLRVPVKVMRAAQLLGANPFRGSVVSG